MPKAEEILGNSLNIAVLVLGDLGRSPRMQYHALSLANLSHSEISSVKVELIGYDGCPCRQEVVSHPSITIHPLSPLRSSPMKIRYFQVAFLFYKVFYQIFQLLSILLFKLKRIDILLVQTPPAIPTLIVACLVCALRGWSLIIDWHNLGYTILKMSKRSTLLVHLYYLCEILFGKCADANFCVTKSMQKFLHENWGIERSVHVLYDRPPSFFRAATTSEKHQLFVKLMQESSEFSALLRSSNSVATQSLLKGMGLESSMVVTIEVTPFTVKATPLTPATWRGTIEGDPSVIALRADRPALLVSSTSWTADEDFDLLLEALKFYDDALLQEGYGNRPRILLVVTGKRTQVSYRRYA